MKFTIITPNLNQGRFLEETILSVIFQEGNFELEYIIIDGDSTDNSQNIIKRYDKLIHSRKFKPNCKKLTFIWISEKDLGQSHAINKGFRIATGDILNWLCADDILGKYALKKVNDFFGLHSESKVVFGLSATIDETGNPLMTLRARPFKRKELIQRWDKVYCEFNLPQSSTFIKREVFNYAGFLNESNYLCMDYEWYLKINKKYRFYFINTVLSKDRSHKDSKHVRYSNKQYKDSIAISKKYWNENYPYYFLSYYFNLFLRTIYRLSTFFKKKSRLYSNIVKIIKNTSFVLFG